MTKNKKYAGLALAAVAALVVGAIASGAANDTAGDPLGEGDGVGPDAVMTSIDTALGRLEAPPAAAAKTQEELALRNSGGVVPSAPGAADSSGRAAGSVPSTGPAGTVSDRKIVQTASVRMQVKGVTDSFTEVADIATSAGGFVASSNFAYQGEQQVATITIRIPAASYQDVLGKVRALGARIDSETSNASDVTEEYSDLQARIRTLEATEQQLLQLLGRATNVSEILQVQDRLNSVRTQIEQAMGRLQLLDKLSDYATISVQLRPLAPPVKGAGGGVDLGEEISRAWDDSLEFLGGIAAGVLTVVVFSWWLLPLAIPAGLVWQRWSRTRPAATPGAYD